MSRIAYVNGQYVIHADASVHVEDRGYQFADGVYEVCEIRDGHLVDERRHLDRLDRSLHELRIDPPMDRGPLGVVLREVVSRNRVRNGLVYMQVTRGVARRDHAFPAAGTPASLVITARSVNFAASDKGAEVGIKVITVPDNRWERVDIKTVGLLPNVLAKQAAKEAGAKEAWFVDASGHVTEGSSTNAWIVTADGKLVTRSADSGILRGITRTVLFDLAEKEQLRIEERAFTREEALGAREAFISSATNLVMPVVMIDGTAIGDGKPGALSRRLRERYHAYAEFSV